MSFLSKNRLDCFWGKSGTLDMVTELLNDQRKITLSKLLNGESVKVEIDNRISLKRLSRDKGDEAFYSLLVQGGYLTLDEY